MGIVFNKNGAENMMKDSPKMSANKAFDSLKTSIWYHEVEMYRKTVGGETGYTMTITAKKHENYCGEFFVTVSASINKMAS
jgi:hypothetical protein